MPAVDSARMAAGGSIDVGPIAVVPIPAVVAVGPIAVAVTVVPITVVPITVVPITVAVVPDLRDHAVRLMKWCARHGLRRCCEDKGKGSKSDQPDHCLSPCYPFEEKDAQPLHAAGTPQRVCFARVPGGKRPARADHIFG